MNATKLPIEFREDDGHVRAICLGASCVWSWRFYRGEVEANGKTLDKILEHVFETHR